MPLSSKPRSHVFHRPQNRFFFVLKLMVKQTPPRETNYVLLAIYPPRQPVLLTASAVVLIRHSDTRHGDSSTHDLRSTKVSGRLVNAAARPSLQVPNRTTTSRAVFLHTYFQESPGARALLLALSERPSRFEGPRVKPLFAYAESPPMFRYSYGIRVQSDSALYLCYTGRHP